MSDEKKNAETPAEESTETPAEETPEEQETPAEEETPGEETPEGESGEGEDEEPGEDVPAPVLREKLTKANAQAADYRTKLRDAEEKLKDAKTPEEVDAIVKQLTADREASETALLRENVALKFKLPEKLQKRLTGTTREELEADAKELAELFGSEDDDEYEDLEGGLSPRGRGDDSSDDPRELAAKHGSRRRR